MSAPAASGLDGVVVAHTALSEVDGDHGQSVIRGHSVETLVGRATFEDACAPVVTRGRLPADVDHGRNASTFTARVVASTGSDAVSATWLEAELAAGRRIMGMGHRVSRVRDPRAAALERVTTVLEESGVSAERLPLARGRTRG